MNSDQKRCVVSEKEAAAYVGLSRVHLRRKRSEGTAPRFVRLGERRIGYRITDLDAWLESRAS
jgi:predicted DNA-binding transcriptional regulator AlpA